MLANTGMRIVTKMLTEIGKMKNLVIIGVAAMLLSNTFQLRTNTRILTSNALDYVSNKIHPYRSYWWKTLI